MTEREAAVAYLTRHLVPSRVIRAIARGDHMGPPPPTGPSDRAHWPCGHERTPDNTQRVGVNNGVRCRTCRVALQAACRARARSND